MANTKMTDLEMKNILKEEFNEYFKENTYANRGMTLENDINETNKYYDLNNIAIIYKKPTPIKVVSVEYPKVKIKEAYLMNHQL